MSPYVLMVDDNPGDLQLIEEAFKDSRMAVSFHTANDAAAAFEHLTRAEIGGRPLPDVVILDLELPTMHGRDVISALRAHRAWKDIPIVVFSGRKAGAEGDGLGADEVVEKPSSYAKYCALVQGLRRYWPAAARSSRRRAARSLA